MWLQADGLEALDRALLLQLPVELDSFVEDLQSFVFPAPHSRAPSNHKCASGHCATPFLYPRWGNTTTNTVDYSTLNDSPSNLRSSFTRLASRSSLPWPTAWFSPRRPRPHQASNFELWAGD